MYFPLYSGRMKCYTVSSCTVNTERNALKIRQVYYYISLQRLPKFSTRRIIDFLAQQVEIYVITMINPVVRNSINILLTSTANVCFRKN